MFQMNQRKRIMADITMCQVKDCEQHAECYRFTARPDTYYQSYFIPQNPGMDCEYFLKVRKNEPAD